MKLVTARHRTLRPVRTPSEAVLRSVGIFVNVIEYRVDKMLIEHYVDDLLAQHSWRYAAPCRRGLSSHCSG
jgi:hypothetical protein